MSINPINLSPLEILLFLSIIVSPLMICITSLCVGSDILSSTFYRRRRLFAGVAFCFGLLALVDLFLLWSPLASQLSLLFYLDIPAAAGVISVSLVHIYQERQRSISVNKSIYILNALSLLAFILYMICFILTR